MRELKRERVTCPKCGCEDAVSVRHDGDEFDASCPKCEYEWKGTYIDVTPDGLFLAAYAVSERLVDLGLAERGRQGEVMVETFAALTTPESIANIMKSSWLPVNKEGD